MSVRGYCVYIEGVLRTFVYAEDIAREAGITRMTKGRYFYDDSYPTDGITEYAVIRWDRFNKYVNLSFPAIERRCPEILPLIQLPIHRYSYIPAEVALIVLMHCESDKAVEFQVVLACKIMPEIQQHAIGYYEEIINKQQNEIFRCEEDLNRYREYTDSLEQDIEKLGKKNYRRY